MVIIVIILCALAIFLYCKYFKAIRCGNSLLITGGIKTGKTLLSVWQAYQLWTYAKIKYYIYNYFLRYVLMGIYGMHITVWLFHKKPIKDICNRFKRIEEKPKLYSNVPLNCEYTPITKDLLKRNTRFAYGSVCYECEASLIADSMTYKDQLLNEELLLFNKLFAHETKGGYLITDTQSVNDLHYSVRRCLNSYIYIHHSVKIPFFHVLFLREERYTQDGQTTNVYEKDVEKSLMIHIIPKRAYKLYDRYAYSVLTDELPVELTTGEWNDGKANEIVSFKDYNTLGEFKKK